MSAPRRVLITGGVRSGKSTYAERLLWEAPATYLATGPSRPDDDEWRARVAVSYTHLTLPTILRV